MWPVVFYFVFTKEWFIFITSQLAAVIGYGLFVFFLLFKYPANQTLFNLCVQSYNLVYFIQLVIFQCATRHGSLAFSITMYINAPLRIFHITSFRLLCCWCVLLVLTLLFEHLVIEPEPHKFLTPNAQNAITLATFVKNAISYALDQRLYNNYKQRQFNETLAARTLDIIQSHQLLPMYHDADQD